MLLVGQALPVIEGISYIFFVYYDRDCLIHSDELATLCAVDGSITEGSISPVDYFFHGLLCLAVSLKAHKDVVVLRHSSCPGDGSEQAAECQCHDDYYHCENHCITPDIQSAQIRA